MKKPAIFLDRDGTINIEKNYLHKIEDWEWIPGAIDAIRMINEMGFLVVVVTNQAGIARGYYEEEEVHALHEHVDRLLEVQNAKIDAYYICPHHPDYSDDQDCTCRKPESGMLLLAKKELNIDLSKSWLIGDKLSDVEAAKNIGVRAILVKTGYGRTEEKKLGLKVMSSSNILSAIKRIKTIVS